MPKEAWRDFQYADTFTATRPIWGMVKRTYKRLRRTVKLTATVCMAAASLQCFNIQTTPRFETFIAPIDSLNLRSMRLALVPTSVPPDIENPEPIATLFDSLVEQSLVRNGFDVVSSSEYRAIWNRLNEEAGGFFDSFTGERDEPQYEAGVRQLIKEMHERFKPDGFLYPELWVVEAPLHANHASWDGTSQRVWPTPSGLPTVFALTFVVVVEDSAGTELFVNGRGLEVMEEFDFEADEMVMLPRERLFRQSELYPAAVAGVLAPLLAMPPKKN